MECCETKHHPDHSGQLPRLNRIQGQVEGLRKMVEERRYCPDILTQCRAVRHAVRALENEILQGHLASCVKEAFTSTTSPQQEAKIAELMELFKRYD